MDDDGDLSDDVGRGMLCSDVGVSSDGEIEDFRVFLERVNLAGARIRIVTSVIYTRRFF
jgi:hypothetical protein